MDCMLHFRDHKKHFIVVFRNSREKPTNLYSFIFKESVTLTYRVPKRDVILTGSVVKSNGVRLRVGSRVGYALLSFTRNCTHNCMDLFSDLMG